MTITPTEKELAAVGISVAAGCRPCLNYHFKEARKAGASDDEIKSAMLDGTYVRRSAAGIMAHFAEGHFKAGGHGRETSEVIERDSRRVLIAIGAAFAVNCAVNLEKYFVVAEELDVQKEDIKAILELSKMIKGRAAHHVERLCKTKQSIEVSETGEL